MRSLLLLVIVFSEMPAEAQQLLLDETYGTAVHRAILLPREEFSRKKVEALSLSFLKTHPDAVLVKYQVATEKYQAYPLPKSPMATFESWLRGFQRVKALDWCMAETLSIGDSAVMRFRGEKGEIERVILKGHDPLLLQIGAARYEILHIDLARGPSGHLANVRVFVRGSKRPSVRRGEEVVRTLARQLPFQRMTVKLRCDPWFATDNGFPDYHPFSHEGLPPTEEKYNSSPTVYCGVNSGQITCSVTGQ
jgi:hypothetical protein